MFSYVAKSLLSKTLKTFLGKYLENIELESIDYGSTSSSSSASGATSGNTQHTSSGWGVSLCNVKLREGMALMKLPGKRKRTVIRKKKVRRNRTKKSSAESSPATKTENKTTHDEGEESFVWPSKVRGEDAVLSENIPDISREKDELLDEQIMQTRDRDSESGYFSSNPSTPTQQRHVICGVPSTVCLNAKSRRAMESQQKAAMGKVPIPFNEDRITNGQTLVEDGKEMKYPAAQVDTPPASTGEYSEQHFSTGDDYDDASVSDDDSFIEVEEEVVVEDDLELVVGAGGVIGTLNIRLIGKELHITVEDAHLLVEAVRCESNSDEGNADEPENKKIPQTSSSSNADLPSLVDGHAGGTTMGEKIKKKSKLAQYLSMIPHLFLRDCRVSLILPETGDVVHDVSSTTNCTVFEAGIDFLSVTEGDEFSEANGFSRKRIRTGKGPDGLWLKIHPPKGRTQQRMRHPNEPQWARQKYLDWTESFFFRASGIDVHARILTQMHTMDGEEDEPDKQWSNECEDYTMDSMLFGVDYVDPVSLTRHQIKNLQEKYKKDPKGGVQSIPFASNFHWREQKVHRSDCPNSHLPRHDCFYCWNEYVHQTHTSTPMPGFVFSLSMAHLEVNVDRHSLEAFGYMTSLFASKKPRVDESEENTQQDIRKGDDAVASPLLLDDKSFPPFMQPDAIYLSSVDVSMLTIRIEAMQPRLDSGLDSGLKFRFWQFVGQSIHFEVSQVDCEEQFLQDVTFHIGSMKCKDFVGVCETNLLVAGVESSFIETPHGSDSEILIPCTAQRVLGVPSPITTDKRLNMSYAVHTRLIRVHVPKEVVGDVKVTYVNLRIGMVDIDICESLMADVSKAFRSASECEGFEFFSKESNAKKQQLSTTTPDEQWLCQVATKGGTISYKPTIKMKIPDSKVRMRKGVEGFSCNSVLHKLGIDYGSYAFHPPTSPSILQLCSLPENLRMNILLYLDDVSPLERVFNIQKKKCTSPFLRSHAINKKLTHLLKSKSLSTKERVRCQSAASRHNYVMSQLQSLDIGSLEALLAMHKRT